MAGYRDTSNYEPLSKGEYGRPLRPFNAWQWVGVAFVGVGLITFFAVVASQLGWISPQFKDSFPAATSLCVIGSLFINSRREQLDPEENARRRRQVIIATIVALAACAVGLAAILYFKGA